MANTAAVRPLAAAGKRILELDGLRGVAILLVLLHHLCPRTGVFAPFGFALDLGWIGVDLFLVLSGYLITGVLLDSVKDEHFYRNFWARRFLRIFPLYYAVLALLYAGVYFLADSSTWAALMQWGSPLWFVLFLANFRWAGLGATLPVPSFFPLWSLQVEEQFYLGYPFLVRRLPRHVLKNVLIGAVVVAPLLRGMLSWGLDGNMLAGYVLMPCRMDALACGGLLSIFLREQSAGLLPRAKTLKLAGMLSAMTLVQFLLNGDSPFDARNQVAGYSLLALTFTAWLAHVVLNPESRITAALRWAPIVFLGKLSYGLYLLHLPSKEIALELLGKYTPFAPDGTLSLLVSFAAAMAAAVCSWYLMESRLLKLKRRFTAVSSSTSMDSSNQERALVRSDPAEPLPRQVAGVSSYPNASSQFRPPKASTTGVAPELSSNPLPSSSGPPSSSAIDRGRG